MGNVEKILLLTILLSSYSSLSFGYKILVMCPAPSRSHNNICRGISSVLVERGHEVTFVGSFHKNNTGSREIVLEGIEETMKKNLENSFKMLNMTMLDTIKRLTGFISESTEKMFKNEDLKNLLNNENETFDAFILEYFINFDLIGFGVHFNCPTIILSPINLMTWLATITGNPSSYAIVPSIFSPYTANMNLWQRTVSTLMTMFQEVMELLFLDIFFKNSYLKYFPKESKRVPYHELKYQIASTLVNSHPSIDTVRPLLPNIVEIGGYHIKDPETLPDDIKSILDDAKHGVIFFSMGSNLKSADLTIELRNTFMKTFASIKETVLWKFEHDLPDKPQNVKIRDWLPQTGILNHPNVKLFISHGGLLSCLEATHFGKPMLIFPVFGDQYHNALEVTERGQGFSMKFQNISDASFKWALNEALSNGKYALKAKQLQELFHDRPLKPRDLAAFQIEHVIRTKGAHHLSPPRLPIYSQILLDVALILLVPIVTFFVLIIFCCKKNIFYKRCKAKEQKKQKKN